jgi:haloalkane dehalogenase
VSQSAAEALDRVHHRVMDLLQTPVDRFARVGGFPYPPRLAEVTAPDGATARMAWVQDGPADGPVVVLLHGEPTWSFLYRRMIPVLAAGGCRVIAPDLIGFGRSDKPASITGHSYARHVGWVRSLLVDVLGLVDVTLFGQDWGGLIGLRITAEEPGLVTKLVASNTGLPTGDAPMPPVWWAFRRAVENAQDLDVGRLVASGCVRGLSPADQAAYDAPFPDESYKAGPRAMPLILPTTPDDPASAANRAAWLVLADLDIPVLLPFSDSDPITGAMLPVLRRTLRGASGRDHPVIGRAGHFIQEDAGPVLADHILAFARAR